MWSELQQSLVDKVNAHPKATWKAGFNDRFAHHTVSDLELILGGVSSVSKLKKVLEDSFIHVISHLFVLQVKHLKKMCGTIMIPAKKLDPSISTVSFDHENLRLPKNFDARKEWDHCPSLRVILGIFRSCNSIN